MIRLTKEDFDSEEEFLYWKKWSDENYHMLEKQQHVENNHTMYLTPELEASIGSYDGGMQQNDNIESILLLCKDLLTDKQFRRYWLYRIEKLTEAEIAEREGVRQQNVSKSIRAAEKIVVGFLETRI